MHKRTAEPTFKINSALGLAAAAYAFIIYLPALRLGFVAWWDDQWYVTENQLIRHIDAAFLKAVFTQAVFSNWHPLTIISYAIDYSIWGLDPFGYHLVNITVHAINTLLVYVLALKIAEAAVANCDSVRSPYFAPSAAFFSAVMFGIHPLHVESVAWVAERKDVLSLFFSLLCLLAYMKYAASGRKALYYCLTLFLFALALMSKPMAVTIPLVLLILDAYPLRRLDPASFWSWVRITVEKIPFFALSAASAILTIWAQGKGIVPLEHYPFPWRTAIAVNAYFFYIFKTVFPSGLAPLYSRPESINPLDVKYIAEYAAFAAVTVYSIFSIWNKKPFGAAWLFYVITLIPVIGLVSVGSLAAADRYTYFPTLSIVMLAGGTLAGFAADKKRFTIFIIAVSALSIPLALLAVRQTRTWHDSISVWTRQIEVSPSIQGYANRAGAYAEARQFEGAISDYTAIIRLASADAKGVEVLFKAYTNRGDSYRRLGQYGNAIDDYARAIELNPGYIAAYNNLGNAYRDKREFGKAAAAFEAALRIEPDNPAVNFNLALTYGELGDKPLSDKYMRKAAALGLKQAGEYAGGTR